MTIWPDYGTPGNPNMDPYYISPEREEELRLEYAQAEDALREEIAAALSDCRRGDLHLGDIRKIVVEELNKVPSRPSEWQCVKPVALP